MIPRLKPYYGVQELQALLSFERSSVPEFEKEFAKALDARYAITFNYGRSAIYATLKSLGIENTEIILPSYTCVVVADAIVLSGNIPKFVDIVFDNYNMDLGQVEAAINSKTGAILATSLFGYPVDTGRLDEIVKNSNQKLLLIQDCAQSFGAKSGGTFVCNQGDVAIFSLRINKLISTILGAIATTNNPEIYRKLKLFRDRYFGPPSMFSRLRRLFYVLSTYIVFTEKVYRLVNFLENLNLLDYFTKSYSEQEIKFPSDAMELLTSSGAELGRIQINKYQSIVEKRRRIAKFYTHRLAGVAGLILPPDMEESTWSYYCPRVKNKPEVLGKMRKIGVQVGEVLEYAIPYMSLYEKFRDREFPNALECSRTTINLPCHPDLGEADLEYIADNLQRVVRGNE